ncbi:MAG: hypothetical protein COT28_11555 [Methylobacterium sp. CG08_land_8_20_14_0_20_71_15]|nr:MAG: hypothetical protein COT56_18660 [Methylobacterium sp. CG09_land_8_20_14_0_10_71_15]PIU13445.1 MAG: hypothetical protein COT28_11555 [Methylobacterium sp. CG08_land_8_20_14_0_20_71_15]GBU17663.1 hypothetical protein AwMethylo_18780 [Methylobacterium sp.]
MPGCRSSILSPSLPARPAPAIVSRYVRSHALPPRPANDNRRVMHPQIWHWALGIGVMPTVGIALLLSLLI